MLSGDGMANFYKICEDFLRGRIPAGQGPTYPSASTLTIPRKAQWYKLLLYHHHARSGV